MRVARHTLCAVIEFESDYNRALGVVLGVKPALETDWTPIAHVLTHSLSISREGKII